MSGSKGGSKQSTTQSGTQTQTLDPSVTAALQANLAKALQTFGSSSYSPVTASQVQGYQSPFTAGVIDTTNSDLARQNQIANQGNNESATSQGAFGGDRSAVLNALTNEDYARTAATTDAGLNQANYSQALSTAQGENTAENQYPLLLQQLLNQTLGLNVGGANKTVSSTGTSNSTGSTSGLGFDLTKLFNPVSLPGA